MGKIPVGETISGAYNFAFARILSVIGVFWLPYLIYGAIIAGAVFLLAPDLPHQLMHGPYDLSLLYSFQRISGILFLGGIIAAAMVAVGLQRQALGLHKGPVFFFFSLGSPVWRMIGAFFLAILLICLMVAVLVGICVAVWFAAGSIGQPGAVAAVRALTIIAAICWAVYFEVRLIFFIPAVVVAEEGIGLGRAWTLAGGNFWRIIVVWIAIIFPVAIGFGMVTQALIGPFMPNLIFTQHQPLDAHVFLNIVVQQFRFIGPLYIVLATVERMIFWGLGNGAIATAYRHLVPASAPVTAA